MRSLVLAAALLAPFPTTQDVSEPRDATPLQVAVIEHRGDVALRDKLVRVMEIWHDAGDFVVGAADPRLIAGLAERKVAGQLLPEVLPGDELFVVDLLDPEIRAELGDAARLVYVHGNQGLVAVAEAVTPRPDGFGPEAFQDPPVDGSATVCQETRLFSHLNSGRTHFGG